MAEMVRIILEHQETCKRGTEAKMDILAVEFLRYLEYLVKRGDTIC